MVCRTEISLYSIPHRTVSDPSHERHRPSFSDSPCCSAPASQAGWRWDKDAYEGAKSGVEQRVTSPSYCFDAGFEFAGYFSGFWPEDNRLEDTMGGGVAISYFFGHNFGLEGSYHLHGSGTAGGSDIQVANSMPSTAFPSAESAAAPSPPTSSADLACRRGFLGNALESGCRSRLPL